MNDKTNVAQQGDERRNAIGHRRRIYVRATENELIRIRSRAAPRKARPDDRRRPTRPTADGASQLSR